MHLQVLSKLRRAENDYYDKNTKGIIEICNNNQELFNYTKNTNLILEMYLYSLLKYILYYSIYSFTSQYIP